MKTSAALFVWLFAMTLAATPAASQPGLHAAGDDIDAALFSQAELEQMLSPIALYPDVLLSTILIAATYPLEIVEAARWSRRNPGLSGEDAVAAVADQDWDASVRALVAFPEILAQLDEDLTWTRNLGDAFLGQEAQMMDTIQALRARADEAGNLRTDRYARIVRSEETIIIEPLRERVVYVPYYDTRVVYGHWWQPAYPPPVWGPPVHYHHVRPGFYWSPGFVVSPSVFFASVHWPSRHVLIVHPPRTRVHHHHHYHHPHYEPGRRWRHDPRHRRGVAYRHPELQQRDVHRRSTDSRLRDGQHRRSTGQRWTPAERTIGAAEQRRNHTSREPARRNDLASTPRIGASTAQPRVHTGQRTTPTTEQRSAGGRRSDAGLPVAGRLAPAAPQARRDLTGPRRAPTGISAPPPRADARTRQRTEITDRATRNTATPARNASVLPPRTVPPRASQPSSRTTAPARPRAGGAGRSHTTRPSSVYEQRRAPARGASPRDTAAAGARLGTRAERGHARQPHGHASRAGRASGRERR